MRWLLMRGNRKGIVFAAAGLACILDAHWALLAAEICLKTRLITTADIFDPITAERPCRGAIPIPRTLEMMAENVGMAIDERCFEALKLALARLPG